MNRRPSPKAHVSPVVELEVAGVGISAAAPRGFYLIGPARGVRPMYPAPRQ